MGPFRHIPYRQRTDAQKIETQWGKAVGLLNRGDWSAAVVRAVTATEISANLAIRDEYQRQGELSSVDVDKILTDSNGLKGKMKVLRKLLDDQGKARVAALERRMQDACGKRNAIVHSGEFCDEEEARRLVENCGRFVVQVVGTYLTGFELTSIEIPPDQDLGA